MRTPVFKCDATVYVRELLRRRLLHLTVPVVIVGVILGVASMSDMRYAYLLLIVLLIVYPMALTMTWLALTAHPGFVLATRPQRWTTGKTAEDAITVEFFRFDSDPDDPGESVKIMTLAASDIERTRSRRRYMILWLRRKECRLLIIPTEIVQKSPQPD